MTTSPGDRSVPTAGTGAGSAARGYGLRPGAGPAVARYAAQVARILSAQPTDEVPDRVAAALRPLLGESDLLAPQHRLTDERRYRRHLLYADREARFTLMAITWRPGQRSRVHGHAAWCAVGVYEGHVNVCGYDCTDPAAPREISDERYGPGAVSAVRPGLTGVHRIYNGSDALAVTLHVYGMDLVAEPEAINVVLAE